MPKWLMWTLIVIVLVGGICLYLMKGGAKKFSGTGGGADTVEVIRDSIGVYHVDSSDKLVHLHTSDHVVWTFAPDTSVDSAVAIFNPTAGSHPFFTTRFEFSGGSISSDSIVVMPDSSHIYVYRITVFRHPHPDSSNADPGIIIED